MITVVILILNKGKGDNKDVLFIDASQKYERMQRKNYLRNEDIDDIVKLVKQFRFESPLDSEEGRIVIDNYAYRATINDIIANDFNLNIPYYLKITKPIPNDGFEKENIENIQVWKTCG